MAFNARIQTKRDTAANWEAKNPVLLDGELIIVHTNAGDIRFKIGDGTKTYTQLPFQDESLYNVLSGKADAEDLEAIQKALDAKADADAIVQSDWNVNDETDPAFVKNKTHWIERPFEPIIWDGSTEGRDSIDVSVPYGYPEGTVIIYKISDTIIDKELYPQVKVIATANGLTFSDMLEYAQEMSEALGLDVGDYYVRDADGNDFVFGQTVAFPVAGDFSDTLGIVVPSSGMYVMPGTSSLSVTHLEFNGDVYHAIDERFLPESVVKQDALNETFAKIEYVDNTTSELDAEITARLSSKMNTVNPEGSGTFSLNRAAGSVVGDDSHASGSNTIASGNASHAEGGGSHAEGYCSHAEGFYSHAEGECSHAEGWYTTASGNNSHAEGNSSHAEGDNSHAEGSNSHAEGSYSHAEGYGTHAEGDYSHAEGENSHAEGFYSHAEGNSSHAEGFYSHAEGENSHAEGYRSHAEGESSHAEGYDSHAEGAITHAEGNCSHAEGGGHRVSRKITGEAYTTVYTISSTDLLIVGASVRHTVYNIGIPTYYTAKIISIDTENSTITVNRTLSDTALSNQSVAVYISGMALGNYSHSEGDETIAAGRSQHVQGEYNIVDPEYDVNDNNKRSKYAHIVGNGSYNKGTTTRSNAHTLDWSGLGWFANGLKVGGTSQDDETAVAVLTEADLIECTSEDIESLFATT